MAKAKTGGGGAKPGGGVAARRSSTTDSGIKVTPPGSGISAQRAAENQSDFGQARRKSHGPSSRQRDLQQSRPLCRPSKRAPDGRLGRQPSARRVHSAKGAEGRAGLGLCEGAEHVKQVWWRSVRHRPDEGRRPLKNGPQRAKTGQGWHNSPSVLLQVLCFQRQAASAFW
jgi:hypothetical protein